MKHVKYSTKKGKQLYEMGNYCCWQSLHNLYDRWSPAKQVAYDKCWEMYCNGTNSTAFGIGNANSFGFTASWLETVDGENVMRIETRSNSYTLWLDR